MADNFLKLDLKHPEEWSIAVKTALMIAIASIFILLGYVLFISSDLEKIKKNQSYLSDMQRQFSRTYRSFHKFKQLEIDHIHAKKQLKLILEQMPSHAMSDANQAIQQAATNSGIQISSYKSLPTEEHAFYILTPLQIKANATYHQAALFISQIANLSQIAIIGNFSLELRPGKNTKSLLFTIVLNLYQPKDLMNGNT